MIELRDYQQDLLERVKGTLADPTVKTMMQLPTGGGKTRIAGELLSGWLEDGRKAVWLTHREELARQTEDRLREAGITATCDMQWKSVTNAPMLPNGVVILMAQTVGHRNARADVWDDYNSRDLMIIDEAHHATADGWARAINQWPGPVLGMTATPWRLSLKEGFDHLFDELHCGLQVKALQSGGSLCRARVLSPPKEEQVQEGRVDYTMGDYSPSSIELANKGHDIWTVGALRFWQEHGEERQTVVYAVSVGHAKNLLATFTDAGIRAGVLLNKKETSSTERAELIDRFQNGDVRVLINVTVATEGFDLPDAACVVLTRPTMSLSLYLQMVGRGLRPKKDGGDCVILDLAGNSLRHGLPEEEREWSLKPRGSNSSGIAPVVWCEECSGISPAASHVCNHCGTPLGKDCERCGKWRATRRWAMADGHAHQHDVVCDFCHLDAHVAANLPKDRELKEVAIDSLLFTLVDEMVRRNLTDDDTRRNELRELIAQRKQENSDNTVLDNLFDAYISSLPVEEKPASNREIGAKLNYWETRRQEELDQWNEELSNLKSKTAIEDKVRRGCGQQLERAQNGFRGYHNPADIEREYFLYLAVSGEEWELLPNDLRSRISEILNKQRQGIKEGRRDPINSSEKKEYLRLLKPVDRAMRSRLITMQRQFERRWPEIWAERQQSIS